MDSYNLNRFVDAQKCSYEIALKLKSSMTLFDIVSPNDIFNIVLNVFYIGKNILR